MRIFSSGSPSSSAAIWPSAVVMPCPSSTFPVAMVTVPSASKCTRCVRQRASLSASGCSTGLFIGCPHDGAHHAVVGATTAEVLVQRLADFLFTGPFVALQERRGGNSNSAHAVTALRRLLGDERSLHRMQLAIAAETLDGGDLLALGERCGHVAGGHRPAVDEHEARAALAT